MYVPLSSICIGPPAPRTPLLTFTRGVAPGSYINTPSRRVAEGRQSGSMSPFFFFRVLSALSRPKSQTGPTRRHSSFCFADSYVSFPLPSSHLADHIVFRYHLNCPSSARIRSFRERCLVLISLVLLGHLLLDRPSTQQNSPLH